MLSSFWSRPTRARGLKPGYCWTTGEESRSRPTRARGLKLYFLHDFLGIVLVAPHAGAWIETKSNRDKCAPMLASRPTRARGLKHWLGAASCTVARRRAPRGRVD